MKHLKTCCFLGLALLLLDAPGPDVRSCRAEVERALPREAGQLLKGVDHWDVDSLSGGALRHLEPPPKRREHRFAASDPWGGVSAAGGGAMRIGQRFPKGLWEIESRFLPMAGGAGRHRSDGRQSGQPDGGGRQRPWSR